jgi:hypothetical protein
MPAQHDRPLVRKEVFEYLTIKNQAQSITVLNIIRFSVRSKSILVLCLNVPRLSDHKVIAKSMPDDINISCSIKLELVNDNTT